MPPLPSSNPLLGEGEPPAAELVRRGRSPFLFVCDHASGRLPRVLGSLGLTPAALASHIAWDIGAAAVARLLAVALDGDLVLQAYSRLVIDCNRPLRAPDSIVAHSAGVPIPGNQDLPAAEAARRAQEIFQPYHDRIGGELARRQGQRRPTVLVAMHSFTDSFPGSPRPWHAGILHLDPHLSAPLAGRLLHLLRQEPGLVVGDNEPYAAGAQTDFTIVEHGEGRGIPHVEVEIRQDLIADGGGQTAWAARLARVLGDSVRSIAMS
jgi:predicted N-formylglutamate amidohydrolase